MGDLRLGEGNSAEKGTHLVATQERDSHNLLTEFRGAYILELKPSVNLIKREGNQFGGLFSRGAPSGPGVYGVSTRGHGVRGEGGVGVVGSSDKQASFGIQGIHTTDNGYGVKGEAAGSGTGVCGQSAKGTGVLGYGDTGVWGEGSGTGAGVYGRNQSGHGVRGEGPVGMYGISRIRQGIGVWGITSHPGGYGTGSTGVRGDGNGTGAGVLGINRAGTGPGVRGEGDTGVFGISDKPGYAALAGYHPPERDGFGVLGSGATGVFGVSDRDGSNAVVGVHTTGYGYGVVGAGQIGVVGLSDKPGYVAVKGTHSGEGFGVIGDAAAGTDTAGVLGRHGAPFGAGVRGEGSPGVVGESFVQGAGGGTPSGIDVGVLGKSRSGAGIFGNGRYGGQFRGRSAQLHLVPAETAGRPTAGWHGKGEIHMDSDATVFVCVADGDPGTWVRVVTEPA